VQVQASSRGAPVSIGSASAWPMPNAAPLDEDGNVPPAASAIFADARVFPLAPAIRPRCSRRGARVSAATRIAPGVFPRLTPSDTLDKL